MNSTIERVNALFENGPSQQEIEAQNKVLKNLQPIKSSKELSEYAFYLRELIGESPNEDISNVESKFDRFLTSLDIHNKGSVFQTIRDIAYGKVFGRDIRSEYTEVTIRDAQALVESGAIDKLDGLRDNQFRLSIAKKLFS